MAENVNPDPALNKIANDGTHEKYPWSKAHNTPNGRRHPRQGFSEVFHYRPPMHVQDAYWQLREWCEKTAGVNFCDLLNSTLPALAYYCLNFAEKEPDPDHPENIRCYVHLNCGRVAIKQYQKRKVHKNWQMDVNPERLK